MGFFDFGCHAGIILLGILGGLAIGIRIVIFKNRLLVSGLAIDWVIISACRAGGALSIMWKQRVAIVSDFPASRALNVIKHGIYDRLCGLLQQAYF